MSVGPIEYLVVAFPGHKFKGDIIPALAELVENETIRILDLVFIIKTRRATSRRSSSAKSIPRTRPRA